MIQLFKDGGEMMWGLLAILILGLAFVIERFITLIIKARLNPMKFMDTLTAEIESNGIDAGRELCDSTPQPVAKILGAGLAKVKLGRAVVEESIAAAGAVELAFLDRGMLWIAMASTLGPIVGFLGTVAGMIEAFAAIKEAGEVDPALVADGISKALITTATGLIIAAPMVLFHTLFTQIIDRYSRDMEQAATSLVDYLFEKGLLTR
ncbi:MotA/TolQ/ExbB proton channel family protein [candidate division WOR-3 bacterium]|uniref:MotA/TolQ/ExbB proton channel family protein n=1 Tax=candidate division WOR-3 bacterium TaxID=2052148 RepID=A0A9D5K980_UNCW3|nr:MotA/TolQ/ExbB proton channel family protein [candidate division WOR-3 bacterium]MBD3364667.1 MotA/TolQ/ExbB proton channel family protein [candidate division WOR-3 bacterium]